MPNLIKPMYKKIIKPAISLLILFILFREIKWAELQTYFAHLEWKWFSLALFVQLLSSIFAGWRWALIMNALKFTAPLNVYIKSYLKSVTLSQILPSNIGGDAYRMIEISRWGEGKKLAILGVLADRIYGFIGLIILNWIALPFAYTLLPLKIFIIILSTNMAVSAGIFLLFILGFFYSAIPRPLRFIADLGRVLITAYQATGFRWVKGGLILLPNFLTVYAFFFISKSFHASNSLIDFLMIIPAIVLLMVLPISLAGWGVREGAMVLLGECIGLMRGQALAISIIFGLILIVTSLPGLYFYLLKKES